MANEKRLIDANKLKTKAIADPDSGEGIVYVQDIDEAPTVDAVSRGVYDQVRWERDVAIEQLESYGVSLGEKADVAKVVHGRWETPAIHIWRCSVCKICVPYSFTGDSYCHNCGAKMDFQSNVPMADAEIDFDYEAED